jgi:hypothetical protein
VQLDHLSGKANDTFIVQIFMDHSILILLPLSVSIDQDLCSINPEPRYVCFELALMTL